MSAPSRNIATATRQFHKLRILACFQSPLRLYKATICVRVEGQTMTDAITLVQAEQIEQEIHLIRGQSPSRFQFGTLKRGRNIEYLPEVFT